MITLTVTDDFLVSLATLFFSSKFRTLKADSDQEFLGQKLVGAIDLDAEYWHLLVPPQSTTMIATLAKNDERFPKFDPAKPLQLAIYSRKRSFFFLTAVRLQSSEDTEHALDAEDGVAS